MTIDNSDLGTIQPRALAGMIDVHELKVINSKIDKVVDSVINEDTQVIDELQKHSLILIFLFQIKHLKLDGNHLLAIPPQFDFMVTCLVSSPMSCNHLLYFRVSHLLEFRR